MIPASRVYVAQVPQPPVTVEGFIDRYEGQPINADTEHWLLTELRQLEYTDKAERRISSVREAIKTVIYQMLQQCKEHR